MECSDSNRYAQIRHPYDTDSGYLISERQAECFCNVKRHIVSTWRPPAAAGRALAETHPFKREAAAPHPGRRGGARQGGLAGSGGGGAGAGGGEGREGRARRATLAAPHPFAGRALDRRPRAFRAEERVVASLKSLPPGARGPRAPFARAAAVICFAAAATTLRLLPARTWSRLRATVSAVPPPATMRSTWPRLLLVLSLLLASRRPAPARSGGEDAPAPPPPRGPAVGADAACARDPTGDASLRRDPRWLCAAARARCLARHAHLIKVSEVCNDDTHFHIDVSGAHPFSLFVDLKKRHNGAALATSNRLPEDSGALAGL
ncbi:Protein of unknown function [Gryllus bimaculatus]|nr:Protein of unknown function [Gryllus bimaculatus]